MSTREIDESRRQRAVEASLGPLLQELDGAAQPPARRIPVRTAAWPAVISDSLVREGLDALIGSLERLAGLDARDLSSIGGELRRQVLRVVADLRALESAGTEAGWFEPPAPFDGQADTVAAVLTRPHELVVEYLRSLATPGGSVGSAAAALDELRGLRAALETGPPVSDENDQLLGVLVKDFTGARGLVEMGRTVAILSRRRGFDQILARLHFSVAGDAAAPVPAPVFAMALPLSSHPVITHQIAAATFALFKEAWERDQELCVEVIMGTARQAAFSASSHFHGLAPALASRDSMPPEERARATVDMYRIASEAQLRPTAWSFLRLRGLPARSMPMLGDLSDLLTQDGSRPAALIASGIHRAWRNAAAHEGHYWDAASGRIVMSVGTASLDDIDEATGRALAVMEGFETGAAYARARIPGLDDRLRTEWDPEAAPFNDLRLRSAFGEQGAAVWSTEWSGSEVRVVLDRASAIEEAYRALTGALFTGVALPNLARLEIRGRAGGGPLIIDRAALDAARRLEETSGSRWDSGVLLPLAASALRGLGREPEAAAGTLARIALRGAVLTAQTERGAVERGDPAAALRTAASINIASLALESAWGIAGSEAGLRLRVMPLLYRAHDTAIAVATGQRGSMLDLRRALNDLLAIHGSLPPDSAFPFPEDARVESRGILG